MDEIGHLTMCLDYECGDCLTVDELDEQNRMPDIYYKLKDKLEESQ